MTSHLEEPADLSEQLHLHFGSRETAVRAYVEALGTSGLDRGLIGPREVPRVWTRHIFNSVVISPLIPHGTTLADVGSGAGLPGLVLAIARPDLTVTLIEPSLRRTTWLAEVLAELGLTNVAIARARAEQLHGTGERWDVVTARAVAPLGLLAKWCLPLLSSGGSLLALKGEGAVQELAEAQEEITGLGGGTGRVMTCGDAEVGTVATVVHVVLERRPSPPAARTGPRSRGASSRGKRPPRDS